MAGSVPDIKIKKRSDLFEKTRKCGLVFQDQMISAFKRNEAGSRDARGHPSTRFKGHSGVLPGMHDKRWHVDLSEKRRHVGIASSHKIADGVCRRTGNPLQFIEPVGLLFGAARNKL